MARLTKIEKETIVLFNEGEDKADVYKRQIKCYDTEKPTLSASLTDGVLTIQGNDTVSGITSVTVNGTTYTCLLYTSRCV